MVILFSRNPVRWMVVVFITQPSIIFVKPMICGPDFFPFGSAEYAIGVISILPNAMEFNRIYPVLI